MPATEQLHFSCTHSVLWQVVGQDEGATVPVEFTYSVKWKETDVTFDKRMDKYRRYQFLPQHLEVRLSGLGVSLRDAETAAGHCFLFAGRLSGSCSHIISMPPPGCFMKWQYQHVLHNHLPTITVTSVKACCKLPIDTLQCAARTD